MKHILIIMIAVFALLGVGCENQEQSETSTDQWTLSGNNFERISSEIPTWANQTFDTSDGVTAGVDTTIDIQGDLEVISSYTVEVVDIPNGRSLGEYPEPVEPTDFYVFILEDEKNDKFVTFVQSMDGESFKVTAFGPATDHRVEALGKSEAARRLDTWPAKELQEEANGAGAKLVMIPYPYAMNQTYYQYGQDIQTARLVHTESGESYAGLTDLLDSIDADWESLR